MLEKIKFENVSDVPGACLSLSRKILVAFWPDSSAAYKIELEREHYANYLSAEEENPFETTWNKKK